MKFELHDWQWFQMLWLKQVVQSRLTCFLHPWWCCVIKGPHNMRCWPACCCVGSLRETTLAQDR